MRQYEVTFIVDPVLSDDGIKSTAQTYAEMLQNEGCTIVHTDEMGLRPLAYPIKNRNSGIYFCVEFQSPDGAFIPKVELALSRDERIMRFLTVALDKFGVKYNDDKRKGLIGKKVPKAVANVEGEGVSTRFNQPAPPAATPRPAAAPVAAAAAAPVVADVVKQEEE